MALGDRRRPGQFAVLQARLLREVAEIAAPHGARIRVHQPRLHQLAEKERRAAGGVEMIDIRLAVRIHACEKGHDR